MKFVPMATISAISVTTKWNVEVIEYEAPETIIARIEERQKAIDAAFKEFKKLLNS